LSQTCIEVCTFTRFRGCTHIDNKEIYRKYSLSSKRVGILSPVVAKTAQGRGSVATKTGPRSNVPTCLGRSIYGGGDGHKRFTRSDSNRRRERASINTSALTSVRALPPPYARIGLLYAFRQSSCPTTASLLPSRR